MGSVVKGYQRMVFAVSNLMMRVIAVQEWKMGGAA